MLSKEHRVINKGIIFHKWLPNITSSEYNWVEERTETSLGTFRFALAESLLNAKIDGNMVYLYSIPEYLLEDAEALKRKVNHSIPPCHPKPKDSFHLYYYSLSQRNLIIAGLNEHYRIEEGEELIIHKSCEAQSTLEVPTFKIECSIERLLAAFNEEFHTNIKDSVYASGLCQLFEKLFSKRKKFEPFKVYSENLPDFIFTICAITGAAPTSERPLYECRESESGGTPELSKPFWAIRIDEGAVEKFETSHEWREMLSRAKVSEKGKEKTL